MKNDKKQINILIDCHFFDYDFIHGATVYLKGLYSDLINRNLSNINFYFVASDTEKIKKIFGVHQNVHFLKFSSNNKFYRLIFDYPNIIKNNKIDFLHSQYISPLIKTCKEIVTTHDVLFNDFPEYFSLKYRYLSNFLFKRSAKRSDILLTVSEYSRHAISTHYKIPQNVIYVTPNAPSFQMLELAQSKDLPDVKGKYNANNYILYVSRFEPRKNQYSLLKAYLELKLWNKNISLVYIGKINSVCNKFNALLNQQSPEIKKWIIHIEQVTFPELTAFISGARLFVYPSFAEGFGIPPLEAAILSTPCLCSNVTAMQDFTFFGNRLFNPSDIEELKSKIIHELSESNLTLNEEIKNQVLKKYQWSISGTQLLNLISKECSITKNI